MVFETLFYNFLWNRPLEETWTYFSWKFCTYSCLWLQNKLKQNVFLWVLLFLSFFLYQLINQITRSTIFNPIHYKAKLSKNNIHIGGNQFDLIASSDRQQQLKQNVSKLLKWLFSKLMRCNVFKADCHKNFRWNHLF